MKAATIKLLLTTVFASTCTLAWLAQTSYATQLPSRLLASSRHQSLTQIAEADSPHDSDSGVKEDGDREATDVTPVHQRVNRSIQTKQHGKHHRKYARTGKSH